MGFYTVVVFNNDCVDELSRDPKGAAESLYRAILHAQIHVPVNVHGRGCTFAEVVAQQHADARAVMALSIGTGAEHLGWAQWGDSRVEIVRRLADDLGFTLRRRASSKGARR